MQFKLLSFSTTNNIIFLQAYSTSLIDVERDYLSMDKRYPRLFIPSEFCKVCPYFAFLT